MYIDIQRQKNATIAVYLPSKSGVEHSVFLFNYYISSKEVGENSKIFRVDKVDPERARMSRITGRYHVSRSAA